jgi:ADP-L-glycero-D-manno-heptose 6-epimerase
MYASSASVYGQGREFKENSPVDPQSPYAWSKYLFDRFVQSVNEYQVNVQGFRFFNVYGPGEEDKGDQKSVFHKFKEQAIDSGVIEVFAGSEDIYRDFIHVGDVCQILEKFLTVDATDIWNIGTGKSSSFMYVAQLMAKKWSAEVKEIPLPDNLKGQYQYHTQANIEKLSNTIGEYKFRPVEEFIL